MLVPGTIPPHTPRPGSQNSTNKSKKMTRSILVARAFAIAGRFSVCGDCAWAKGCSHLECALRFQNVERHNAGTCSSNLGMLPSSKSVAPRGLMIVSASQRYRLRVAALRWSLPSEMRATTSPSCTLSFSTAETAFRKSVAVSRLCN